MNKALVVAIRSKWLEMILNGKKTFEFRNWKVEKGTVIYFYCTKAKPYLHYRPTENCDTHYVLWDKPSEEHTLLNGKVVAKAVVKEVYEYYESYPDNQPYAPNEISFRDIGKQVGVMNIESEYAHSQGYTNQRYALELTDIEAIEPREIESFYSYNKSFDTCPYAMSLEEETMTREERLINRGGKRLTHAPQSRVWVLEEEE